MLCVQFRAEHLNEKWEEDMKAIETCPDVSASAVKLDVLWESFVG